MKELRKILDAYAGCKRAGVELASGSAGGSPASGNCALATVIHVSGSAYRRPGAKMLITLDGSSIGSVSGGCLERDVIENAVRLLSQESSKSLLLQYDTNHDEDAIFGLGTGCTGSVLVFVEKLAPSDPLNILHLIQSNLYSRKKKTLLATIVRSADERLLGAKLCLEDADCNSVSCSTEISAELRSCLAEQLWQQREKSCASLLSFGDIDLYIESVNSLPHLYIFGAGHDAVPLADLACSQGLQVSVFDHRKSFAEPRRFPAECKVSHYRPEDLATYPEIKAGDCCVLMAHNFSVDQQSLRNLISTDATYIGVLGPKKRTERMLNQFAADGVLLTEEQKAKIFAPIGLDIGAETPDEIALSILAEIKAASNKRSASFLRERNQPIHTPPETQWINLAASERNFIKVEVCPSHENGDALPLKPSAGGLESEVHSNEKNMTMAPPIKQSARGLESEVHSNEKT